MYLSADLLSSSRMPTTPPFHNSPQRFNKTHQKASETTQSLVALLQKGPRTVVGTVTDVSFHLTMGYVTCTTQLGIVQVVGIPAGTVTSGMRVYCRQMGGMSTNRSYVFDGYAPALASMGPHGSLMITAQPALAAGCATVSSVSALVGQTGPQGYYWHCFFYLPALPLGTGTLLQFAQTGSLTTTFTIQVLPSCLIQVISNTGHGYVTSVPIPPHQLHWLMIQPGNTGSELLIDGIATYTGITTGSDEPVFAGGSNTYSVSLGTSVNGTQLLPLGAWISKVGYGTNTSSTFLPTSIPAYDSDLINSSTGGVATKMLYLFEDTPGGTTAINSAVSPGAGTLTVSTPAQIVQAGPY